MRLVTWRAGSIVIAAIAVAAFSAPRLAGQDVSPQSLYDQAGKALDAGDSAQAIKLYEELLQERPNSVEGRINLGVALAQEGRYTEAVQQYRQALARDPQNETTLLNLGLAFYKQADFEKARIEFENLHRAHPSNQQALYLLADCDLRMKRFKDAIALVEPAYAMHPDDQALDYILGTALIQDGQTEKGAQVIDQIMRSGNAAVAYVLLGTAQEAAGDHKAAAETLRKAVNMNPEIPGAWTIYARALLNNDQREEGKAALQRALQADPNDFDACLHLGVLLRREGNTEDAQPYLKHALQLRPDSSEAQFQVGTVDAITGHLDDARSTFEKLVKQWPGFMEAHVQLAMVYARLHRIEDSQREQRIVMELNDKARAKGPQPDTIP